MRPARASDAVRGDEVLRLKPRRLSCGSDTWISPLQPSSSSPPGSTDTREQLTVTSSPVSALTETAGSREKTMEQLLVVPDALAAK
jgi:hypothetical protein